MKRHLINAFLIFMSVACGLKSAHAASGPSLPGADTVTALWPRQPDSLEVPGAAGVPGSGNRTFYYIAGTAVITAGLVHFDQQTYSTLLQWKQRSTSLEAVSPVITTVGNGVFSVGLFGGYLGYGALFDNAQAARVGRIGLESFAASGLAVQILKVLFGRERPSVATRPGGKWSGPFSYFHRNPARSSGLASFDAFPSGHTTTVFAAAATLSDAYSSPWVSCISYSIASGVAISRIMEGTHWMSDCFVGGLIGILSTKSVEKLNALPLSIAVGPVGSRHMVGVTLVLAR